MKKNIYDKTIEDFGEEWNLYNYSNHDTETEKIFKALNLKSIYGREMFETWYKGLALIDSGLDVKNVITHSFHYTEFEKAFELLNKGKAGKVVLNWD